MYRPLESGPVPDSQIPFFNKLYLHSVGPGHDPTMTWATDVDMTRLGEFIAEASRARNILLSPAHVLAKAVAVALVAHPQFNRRVVGRKIYRYRDVNILMSFQNRGRGEADLVFLKKVDQQPLAALAENLWRQINLARRNEDPMSQAKRHAERFGTFAFRMILKLDRWFNNRFPLPTMTSRLMRFHASPVVINCLNYAGAPPLRHYKATQLGNNSWCVHVAFGPTEMRPVVEGDAVVVRPTAMLIVRIDHRLGDAIELGRFTGTIRDYLADPNRIPGIDAADAPAPGSTPVSHSEA